VKKVSLLSLVALASLVGALGVAPSASASAPVLCKIKPSTHKCGSANMYPVGTTISGKLAGSSFSITTESKETIQACSGSEFSGTLNENSVQPFIGVTSFTATGCAEPNMTIITWPKTPTQDRITYIPNTDNGKWWGGTEIKVGLRLLYPEAPTTWNCRYQLTEGELVGGAAPVLAYTGGPGYAGPGAATGNEWYCPKKVRVWAKYALSPMPIYVEEL